MNEQLFHINQKINTIQSGLLRYQDQYERMAFDVRIAAGDKGTVNCIVNGDCQGNKLLHKKVSLVQRYKDDYIYISGKVIFVAENASRVISINILRAFWFTRKMKGHISWLQNKYVYDQEKGRA